MSSNDGPSDEVEDFAATLKRMEQSLQSQIRDLQRSLGHSIDVAVQHVNTQKQALEVSNAKLRVVEQRTLRHSNEIKFLNRVVEKHGLSEDMAPLRQELLELMAKEEQSCESMRELSESLWRDFGGLKKELEKLSAKDTEQEISNLSALLQQMTSDYSHFTCWARPLLEEFLPLPAEVKDFHRDVADLRMRQERCEDDVNKIQRLGRILDDKVEVFDDLQRRMEELNANARSVLGSQFATSVRCLCCKDEPPPREAPAPPTVVKQLEVQARRRPQSAGARLEREEKKQMVFSVPRVRTDFPKQGSVVGIRGISIFKPGGPAKPTRRRPQSARACLQSGPDS